MIGDSRVSRWSPLPELPQSLALVQRGVGGETLHALTERFKRDGLACRPRALLLQSGINDLVAASFMDEVPAQVVCQSVLRGLQGLADAAAAAGVPLLVTTLIPPGRRSGPYVVEGVQHLAQLTDQVNRQLAQQEWPPGVQGLDLRPALSADDGLTLRRSYQSDTLHLSPEGYAALNEAVAPVLAALLRRPLG